MPIEYHIDHVRRLVLATGHGTFTDEDVFGYQCEVWSRADVAGYDELVDMSDVQAIVLPSARRVLELADLSAGMDENVSARFAIVAPDNLAYGLGRMYEAYRGTNKRSTKIVRVFRSRPEAIAWLAILKSDQIAEEPQGPLAD